MKLADLQSNPSPTYKWGVIVRDSSGFRSLGYAKTQKDAIAHARCLQHTIVHISRRYEQWELTRKALK